MANEQQLKLDLEELKHLESIAKRPRVISLLSSEIRNLDSKISKASAAPAPPPIAAQALEASNALNNVALDKFCWDQDNDKIKLKPSMDKDKDPMGGIMDLMKNGIDQVEILNLFREMLQAYQQQTAELIHIQQRQIAILQQGIVSAPQVGGAVCTFHDLRPETFSGTEGPLEADDWISTMEEMLRVAGVAPELQVDVVRIQLKGLAKDWWKTEEVRLSKPIEWDVFRTRFFAKFFPKTAQLELQRKLTNLRQGNHTVGEYATEFSRLRKFVPNMVALEEYHIWLFQMGLNDDVQESMTFQEFRTYNEVLNAALRYELASTMRRDSGVGIKRPAGFVQHQRGIQAGLPKKSNQGTWPSKPTVV